MCVDTSHNLQYLKGQEARAIRVLVADRRDHHAHHPEAEEVCIVSGRDAVEFACSDGISLTFVRGALVDALSDEKAQTNQTGGA